MIIVGGPYQRLGPLWATAERIWKKQTTRPWCAQPHGTSGQVVPFGLRLWPACDWNKKRGWHRVGPISLSVGGGVLPPLRCSLCEGCHRQMKTHTEHVCHGGENRRVSWHLQGRGRGGGFHWARSLTGCRTAPRLPADGLPHVAAERKQEGEGGAVMGELLSLIGGRHQGSETVSFPWRGLQDCNLFDNFFILNMGVYVGSNNRGVPISWRLMSS